ncbi:MAG: NAD-dependent epimerase/dehydratase family protein [Bacteroidota bacterium]|nr:NAD-dependent epimerase/dehydratase family protein [Bacteroidota bacterium]MEC9209015.1 NAD-dependent epimerase/dehydratase family protein [Bacteroidota bacterium]
MIFVTGGTGLVGSHVLLKLAQQSKGFKALKRVSSSLDVCKSIFTYYNADDLFAKINWIDGDINDIPSLEEGMKDCDLLLHCAGLVSFSPFDIELLRKVNIEGTANVMNVALSSGIKKAGFVSSIAALGRNSTVEVVDEQCHFKITKLDSNYALSKYFSEQEVWRASGEGLDVVIVNPSVILGPGDWTKGSSKIFEKLYKGLKFYTSGSTGYVDVDDVAESVIQLLFSDVKNQRFIVNGANLKYRDCFDRIAVSFGKPKASIKVTPFLKEIAWRVEALKSLITGKMPLITKETANSAMTDSSYTTAKIEETLGFQFTDIDASIKKYTNWFIADQS